MLVRPNKDSLAFVNLESEEKFYTNDRHFCPQDGFVAFRRGELISGNLGTCVCVCVYVCMCMCPCVHTYVLVYVCNVYIYMLHTS